MNKFLNGKILVTSNRNPDLDGYSSSIGYANLLIRQGFDAKAILLGRPQIEVGFVANYLNDKLLHPFEGNVNQFDTIVILDTSHLDSIQKDTDPKKLKLIIDHRMVNESHLYPHAQKEIEKVGACATLIAEKYLKAQIKPDRKNAIYLYGAIISNTINFQNKVTTVRDKRAAKYLQKIADIPNNFIAKLFEAKSDLSDEKLLEHIEGDTFAWEIDNKVFVIAQLEIAKAKKFLRERNREIEKIINSLVEKFKPDYCFLNIIDIFKAHNYIFTLDQETEMLLEKVMSIHFKSGIAQTKHIFMRKEITPLIKEYFEK